MAFGVLIIKVKMGLTDIETVEQITENPYLQYFVGLHEYRDEAPFDSSIKGLRQAASMISMRLL